MSLKNQINTDYITAFKSKDGVKKSILSVIKGEIQTQEKNLNVSDLTDGDVMKILTKVVKSLNETITQADDQESKLQLEVVSKYMPKQMSEKDIRDKMTSLIQNGVMNIGDVMKAFAKDSVDKKLVSQIYQEVK
jgi:uncharacterized protein YqeY